MDFHSSIDDGFATLHAAGWSVGTDGIAKRCEFIWFLYGYKGDQKILWRAASEGDAWRAALKSAEAASEHDALK